MILYYIILYHIIIYHIISYVPYIYISYIHISYIYCITDILSRYNRGTWCVTIIVKTLLALYIYMYMYSYIPRRWRTRSCCQQLRSRGIIGAILLNKSPGTTCSRKGPVALILWTIHNRSECHARCRSCMMYVDMCTLIEYTYI